MERILDDLFLFCSTCNVYVIRSGNAAVLIDFGDGSVLKALAEIGVESVTAILLTHHHRDQAQGLDQAVKAGIPIWAPDMERELFSEVDWHWQGRNILNNYNVREDRFSLLHSVSLSGCLKDYETVDFNGVSVQVVPTPGHTPGSISLAVQINGKKCCFVGDLIYDKGKLWSLAATQWTYNGAEGIGYHVLSLLALKDKNLDYLLPSHGNVMDRPAEAIDPLVAVLLDLLHDREAHLSLLDRTKNPFHSITPHVYRNLTTTANSYVVVSDSGHAMFIDYGYDFVGGFADGTGRASRRPWLYTIPALKQLYGVTQVEVALPTHYHDDHVAGFNLLQKFEGTQVWCAENFSDILESPTEYNLPCLWFDPIHVDRVLPLKSKLQWHEFSLTLYPLPGHTRYAVAILLEADGKRILFTGDEFQGDQGLIWNYVYQNRYDLLDYDQAASLYTNLHPDIILSGHWDALYPDESYFQKIAADAARLSEYHRKILPLDAASLGVEGFIAHLYPYQMDAQAGGEVTYNCEVTNPIPTPQRAQVRLVTPDGWTVTPIEKTVMINPQQTIQVSFTVHIPEGQRPERRVRLAAEVTLGDHHYGEQAEALISIHA